MYSGLFCGPLAEQENNRHSGTPDLDFPSPGASRYPPWSRRLPHVSLTEALESTTADSGLLRSRSPRVGTATDPLDPSFCEPGSRRD